MNFVLGVGLHSYGFGTGGFGWALLFVVVEIAFVILAVIRKGRAGETNSPPPISQTQLVS